MLSNTKILEVWCGSDAGQKRLAVLDPSTSAHFSGGRSPNADIHFAADDLAVSRRQFELEWTGRRWELVNQGETLRVGWRAIGRGQRISVAPGMTLRIAATVLRFQKASAGSTRYELAVTTGLRTRGYPLEKDRIGVGCSADNNDLTIDAPGVSKLHFELSRSAKDSSVFTLRDVGSTNGIRLLRPLKKKLAPGESVAISPGQVLRVGSATVRLRPRRTAVQRSIPWLAAGAAGLVLLAHAMAPNPPHTPPCIEKIASALDYSADLATRVDRVHRLARAKDRDLVGCSACSAALAELGRQALGARSVLNRMEEVRERISTLRAAWGRNLWSNDWRPCRDEEALARAALDALRRGYASRASVGADAPIGRRSERLKEIRETQVPAGQPHAPVEWPSLFDADEMNRAVETSVSAADELLNALEPFQRLALAALESGTHDPRSFTQALASVLSPESVETARTDLLRYAEALEQRREDWSRLAAAYQAVLSGNSSANGELPAGWAASGILPGRLQTALEANTQPALFSDLLGQLKTRNPDPSAQMPWIQEVKKRIPHPAPPLARSLLASVEAFERDQESNWARACRGLSDFSEQILRAVPVVFAEGDWVARLRLFAEQQGRFVDEREQAWQGFRLRLDARQWDETRQQISRQWGDLRREIEARLSRVPEPEREPLRHALTELIRQQDPLVKIGAMDQETMPSLQRTMNHLYDKE